MPKNNFLGASLGLPNLRFRFINDLLYENLVGKSIAQKNTLLMLLEVYIFGYVPDKSSNF